jgi:nicotinamidase-related amidase
MAQHDEISRRALLRSAAATGIAGNVSRSSSFAGSVELMLQTRDQNGRPHRTSRWVDPKKIGVIAVDVWNYHWCRTWRTRAGSLIPRMNYSFDAVRRLGMTLVFSPTNAMRDLNDSPERKATLALPNYPLPPLKNLPDPYPDALKFGMCECGLGDDCFYAYNSNNQHPDLRMIPGDFIALTQQEAYNIFKERGITDIIYTGFATNICVWAKPTGAKYMRQFGFQCMLARDLTEAMTGYVEESFNPTQGTLEVIELIERELAPSINMEETLRRANAWGGEPVLDFVHIAPWGRFFGGAAFPVPIQAELTCRHVPGAELRYTVDGSDPTSTSPLYRKPIQIADTTFLKAAGFKGERPVTRISEAKYWKYPPVVDPPDVFISDMDPVSEVIGKIKPNSYAIAKNARFNRSVNGQILCNRDSKYFKGIGVQTPSELVFQLKPEYKRFVAFAGVDDECMYWDSPDGLPRWPQWSRPIHGITSYRISQVIFEVRVDGRRVAETPPMFNGDRAWSIDVMLPPDSHEITLAVKDVESRTTDPHGHADWLNAGFLSA